VVSGSQSDIPDDELEAAVNDAIAACDGNMRAAIRALIVAKRGGRIDEIGFARLYARTISHLFRLTSQFFKC
jgi:hypothetical protein